MPGNKKPKKRYQPRDQVLPFGRSGWLAEGGVHGALIAMDAGQLSKDNLGSLVAHAAMAKRLSEGQDAVIGRHAEAVLRIAEDIVHRTLDANDFLQVMELEKASIHASLSITIDWLRRQPNMAIRRAAMASLDELAALRRARHAPP